MRTLYMAAKAPVAGEVKTRLGATIGMKPAADLYRAFVADLSERFAGEPYRVGWHVAPGAWPRLAPVVRRADTVREQHGDGWAVRQAELFREHFARDPDAVVLIATDSPQLERARVREAFAALERAHVVFGPTPDGGYYLVGMSHCVDVFSGVAMSTASALDQAMARARMAGAAVALLEPEFDVDTVDDLPRLASVVAGRADLARTAEALAALGAAV